MSCPFDRDPQNQCRAEEDLQAVAGVCPPGAFGRVCGPVAGYTTLVNNFNGLKDLDAARPIIATFTLDQVPDGSPPLDIREDWVGVQLPARQGYDDYPSGVKISPADAVLGLLMHGKMNAADWFWDASVSLMPLGPRWEFQSHEGTIAEIESASSKDYYSQFVPDAVRVAIDSAR